MSLNGNVIHPQFSKAYYKSNVCLITTWMGKEIVKCPMDLFTYSEILHEVRPDTIVETGTFLGGSALYLAHMCDILDAGKIVSIDIRSDLAEHLPEHPRIEFLLGRSSIDPEVVQEVKDRLEGTVMVILDSDHECDHVLQELRLYHKMVSVGSYLIVEDTNIDAYQVMNVARDSGPAQAIKSWQPKNNGFEVDRFREKFLMSFNPGGYLKRIR